MLSAPERRIPSCEMAKMAAGTLDIFRSFFEAGDIDVHQVFDSERSEIGCWLLRGCPNSVSSKSKPSQASARIRTGFIALRVRDGNVAGPT